VTFRSTLRQTRKPRSFCVLHRSPRVAFAFSGRIPLTFSAKSFHLNLFTDPHPLTLVAPIFYKKVWGEGPEPLRRSDTQFVFRMGLRDARYTSRMGLSPLESAVADKHSVLPVFNRNRPRSSPLEATLMIYPVSVDSKWFAVSPKSFRCNTYKKHGGGVFPTFQRQRSTFKPSNVPSVPLQPSAFGATIHKGTRFLLDPGKQLRSPRCLRDESGHRGLLDLGPLLQVVPGFNVLKLNRSAGWLAIQQRVGKAGSVRLG